MGAAVPVTEDGRDRQAESDGGRALLRMSQVPEGMGAVQDVETAIVMRLAASLVRELQDVTFIDVSCEADTVTLAGQVDSQASRDLAERVARQHPGGLKIVNNLEILPPASTEAPSRP